MSHANHALWMARFRDRAKTLKRHIVLPEGRTIMSFGCYSSRSTP